MQSTLLVGGLVLLLLAGFANLVTRQVVRPVRSVTQAAERFASGELGERVVVVGEDDVAWLAQSYDKMTESIELADLPVGGVSRHSNRPASVPTSGMPTSNWSWT